jgi:hypothetical protein
VQMRLRVNRWFHFRLGLGVAAALLLMSTHAVAGKLADTRSATGASSSRSSDSSDDDDCSFLTAILFGCGDEPTEEHVEPTPVADEALEAERADAEAREAERRRDILARSYFFLPYPYAGHAGTLSRERLPGDRLVYTSCRANDSACRTREHVVTCVGDDCYRFDDREPIPASSIYPNLKQARLALFADGGRDQDGLTRLTLGAAVMSNLRFALESRFTYWSESLEEDEGPGKSDGLWIGDLNVHYQILAYPPLQSYIGLGPRIATDGTEKAAGINMTSITELYPLRPLVFRIEGDVGSLGQATFLEAQASAGLVWKHFEAYAGYDVMRVAHIRFNSWFTGLRVHL